MSQSYLAPFGDSGTNFGSFGFFNPVWNGSKTHSTPESDEPKFLKLRLIFFETPAPGNAWFLKFQNFLFLLLEAVLPP